MWNPRKPARLAKTHVFRQKRVFGQRLPYRFLKYHVATVSLDHWMVATKMWTSSLVCRGRQTTARGGCNVRQSALLKFLKISIKNSKCAASNKHIQDGRPGRYKNRRGSEKRQNGARPSPRDRPRCPRKKNQKRLKRTKPRVVSYPQRMSWKARRRSRTRRWFARRFWKLHEDQHVLSFSLHL